jgi:ABC-type bacteriocin/lantibiotic exporter with double-glycine peptidase domain
MILAEADELAQFFGQAVAVPLVSGLTLLAVTGYMAYLNPWMALFALHPLQLWLTPRLQQRVKAFSRERVLLGRQLSDHLQWSVGHIEEIHTDDRPARALQRFRDQADGIFRIRLRIYRLKYLIKWIGNFLAKLGPFFLFVVGGWLIIERPGTFDVGGLVAALAAYERLNEPWQDLLDYYQQKEIAKVRYEADRHGLRSPVVAGKPSVRVRSTGEARVSRCGLDAPASTGLAAQIRSSGPWAHWLHPMNPGTSIKERWPGCSTP